MMRGKHLLSVRDLDLSAHIGELLDAGVTSFKIEGRLKDASYVRNIVGHYSRLLDEALVARNSPPVEGWQPELLTGWFRRTSTGSSELDFTPDPAKSFTRGATDYFLHGAARGVASFDTPKSMGEPVGRVEKTGCDRTGNKWFIVRGRFPSCGGGVAFPSGASRRAESTGQSARRPITGAAGTADGVVGNTHRQVRDADGVLMPGDGICFFSNGELQGTNINRIEGDRVYPNKMDGIEAGTEIYRNYDHAFTRAVERSRTRRRIGVSAAVDMNASQVSVAFTDETGLSVTVSREGVFDEAKNPEKMLAVLRDELARSGDTIFEVKDVAVGEGSGHPVRFIPVSMLAAMRREGLQRLTEVRERLAPERNPAVEDISARFPRTHLTAAENVTNRLAEQFYRDHGVTEIEPALELRGEGKLEGATVMQTRYCIRREMGECGECLREGSDLRGDLFLERGRDRYRLDFDCAACEMRVLN